jgi:V8-like Glu-specific endopeptidase
MNAVLTKSPYPWVLPEARELHVALCEIYPTPRAAVFVAVTAGLNQAMLNPDQAAYLLWMDVLNMSATSKRTEALVRAVASQNPTSPRVSFFDSLLNDQPIVKDSQPRTAQGDAIFLAGSTIVSQPEALLFHDDLTMTMGRIPWLIGVLQRLQTLGPSVCRLETSMPGDGQYGTAFRIADDLLLTNWHVVNFGAKEATKVVAEFFYEDDAQGNGLATKTVDCDAKPVAGNANDDWAVVKVQSQLPGTIPIIRLSAGAAPVVSAQTFIIQHPAGQRKRVAFVRNQITELVGQVVHYLSDTQAGSSGAPVFDDQGRIVALHRAGGVPQEVAGKPPLKKNEGVLISRVAQAIAAAGVAVP